jgi:penicillin-binding protein 1C
LIDNQEEAPKITSPSADKQYIIDREDPPQMQLQCKAAQEVRKIYWYLNEKFYKVTRPNQAIFFTPELGLMKIGCTDDQGRQSQITIQVQYE